MPFSSKINKYVIFAIVIISLLVTLATVLYLEYDVEYLKLPLKYFFIGLILCIFLLVSYARLQNSVARYESKTPKGFFDHDDGYIENDNSNLDDFIEMNKNKNNKD